MELACTRTLENGLMIFIQKQILLLLTLLSAQESQFQQRENLKSVLLPEGFSPWTPNGHFPCTPLGASGGQWQLLSLILLLLEIFLTTLVID